MDKQHKRSFCKDRNYQQPENHDPPYSNMLQAGYSSHQPHTLPLPMSQPPIPVSVRMQQMQQERERQVAKPLELQARQQAQLMQQSQPVQQSQSVQQSQPMQQSQQMQQSQPVQQSQPMQQSSSQPLQLQFQPQQQYLQSQQQFLQPQMVVPYRTPYTYNYGVPVLPPPPYSAPGQMVYGALPARRYSEQSLGISSAGVPFRSIVRKPGSEPVPSIDGKHVNNLQRSESRLSVASVNTQPAVSAQRPITSFPITRASSTSQTQLRTSPIQHSYQSQQLSPYPYQPYGADGPYMHPVAYGAAPDPYYAYTGQPPVQPGYASPPYVGRGNVYPGGLVPNSLQRVVIPPSGSPAVAERPRAISKRRSTTSRKNRSCSICHKVFNRPSGLRIHMHTHTGEALCMRVEKLRQTVFRPLQYASPHADSQA
ncbi:DEBR0S5_12288g1_1 [Brettanomyces bruxellensis]|uniref:DEBR0S5_12288g1_1 n=1 Tax=Dekkera bruxellensis TaxID=5007 RepID=A0A7D9D0Q7_DEKBR|nr:DEBR0S5_12288g1_1 [Brettanomyces bruxellensis]